MGVSYAKIICHLDMLKHERRRITNLRDHPYKETDKEQVDVKEIVTRQMLDRSQQNLQVTYTQSSNEAEKEICETPIIKICKPASNQIREIQMIKTQSYITRKLPCSSSFDKLTDFVQFCDPDQCG